MIHRDIKPTNIFLCRMGNEYDFAKVLDFGLVKVLNENESKMTVEGATTGTPAYMAPELAMGYSDLDARVDLYGLGCVAYWLITGSLVFEEKNAAAMMLAHLQKAPIAPSMRNGIAIPDGLDRTIMMCLAKKPADRPATAEVLADLLEGCRDVGSWTLGRRQALVACQHGRRQTPGGRENRSYKHRERKPGCLDDLVSFYSWHQVSCISPPPG